MRADRAVASNRNAIVEDQARIGEQSANATAAIGLAYAASLNPSDGVSE
jgi:hypothetical protein